MALLADYAITPDVFDVMSYPNEEVCEARLELIREPLLTEGLVRDIRDGEWRRFIENPARAWHRRGKELIRKLATQGRLVQFSSALPHPPVDDQGWCAEALDSHRVREFAGGIIVTEAVKRAYLREPLVARIDRFGNTRWWASRSPSVTLARSLQDYQQHLDPIFRCANSLMFVDPHINPAERRYHSIGTLMQMAGNRTPAPSIEIHRVCRVGSGPDRRIEDRAYFEALFRDNLANCLHAVGLQAKVFIWDDFHDRYLISNLIGILLPNGFDTTQDPNSVTRWTRLGRNDRDDVQREFDPVSRRHTLRASFTIP